MGINRHEKVLVVEDSIEMRSTLRICLEELGFAAVLDCDSGDAAKRLLSSNEFALIVSDWIMPGVSGLELLQTVRESARHKDVPFIMITGQADRNKVMEATKYGVSGFLVKPFPISDFQKMLDRANRMKPR